MSGIQVTATVQCDGGKCGHVETVTVAKMADVRHVLQRRGWDCTRSGSKDYCPDCSLRLLMKERAKS